MALVVVEGVLIRHLQWVCQKNLAKGNDVYWVSLDVEKTDDRSGRDAMWKRLPRLYDFAGSLLRPIQSLQLGCRTCVIVGSEVSDWFP